MQLKEIRDLFVFFLKQLNKNDVNLLLNYLPIFLEDIQRDPLLLDKLPAVNILNFKGFEQPNVLAAIAATATISSTASTITKPIKNINSTEYTDGSDEENKNDENLPRDESASGTDNDYGSMSNHEENNQTGNNFNYESYDEDEEENIDETNQTTAQYLEPSQIVRSRLPSQTIDYLTKMYNINKYPNSDEIYQISLKTNLTTKKVKTWFDSTRFKLKHSKKNNFTPKIVNFLMSKYEANDNPSRNEILEMANEMKLSETQVYHWFRYKRQAGK